MPEDYGPHKISVPKAKGEAPNGPQGFKDLVDDVSPLIPPISGAGAGKIVVVDSGAPAYKAMSGDATIDNTGKLTLSNTLGERIGIGGEIAALGEVLKGAGFSSEKTATGVYKITLTNSLVSNAVIVATSSNPIPRLVYAGAENAKKTFLVRIWNVKEELINSSFAFSIFAP